MDYHRFPGFSRHFQYLILILSFPVETPETFITETKTQKMKIEMDYRLLQIV